MIAKLIGIEGPAEGAFFELAESQVVTIGRDPLNVLAIRDASVSPRHALISADAGRFRIADLESAAGTFINGVPVTSHALENGDQVRTGDAVFLFLVSGSDAEVAEVPPPAIEHNLVGESPRLLEVCRFIARVAPVESTALIQGESGTGKELAARAIHANSRRRGKPFVAINCAALTESLLESELFGHERGAFTGAIAQKRGRLEVADSGTLFLDEIGEMNQALQAKLLRVLQEREFERVGGTRSIRVDVRLVAATNQDLLEAVRAGRFREDLYYRLNVVSVRMPPLRERRQDIPLLASYFLARHRVAGRRRIAGISDAARACLLHYDWPGNVRELENAIERAVVLGSTELILPEDLPETVLESAPADEDASGSAYHAGVREAKRQLILRAMQEASGSYADAARLLGLHPNYLHRLIRNLNLKGALHRRAAEDSQR